MKADAVQKNKTGWNRYGVSLMLLLHCGCMHSANDIVQFPSEGILIAAHRGGYENDKADQAPENSIANILNCQKKGYDLCETDINRTRDGQFVIMHDQTLNRETTGTGKTSDATLAELKQLHKRYRDGTVSEERVASLAEFLEAGKGRTIFKIDLRCSASKCFSGIMEQVVECDALDQVVFRVPYAQVDLFARYKDEGGSYTRSLLMFMVSSKKQVDDIQTRFDPVTIQIHVSKTNPTPPHTLELIRYATRQGLLVQTHDYGTEEDWVKLIDSGVRMLHTYKPAEIKTFLQTVNEDPSSRGLLEQNNAVR
jgi:hypothetical protein